MQLDHKIPNGLRPDEPMTYDFVSSPDEAEEQPEYLTSHNQYQTSMMSQDHLQILDNLSQVNQVFGTFDELQNLLLLPQDTERIHNYYKHLYMSRLSLNKLETQAQQTQQQTEPAESFQLSELSQQLALNRRNRIIEHMKIVQPQIVEIDLNQLFQYQKYQNELQKQQQLEQTQNDQLKECTFKYFFIRCSIFTALFYIGGEELRKIVEVGYSKFVLPDRELLLSRTPAKLGGSFGEWPFFYGSRK